MGLIRFQMALTRRRADLRQKVRRRRLLTMRAFFRCAQPIASESRQEDGDGDSDRELHNRGESQSVTNTSSP